MRFKTGRLQRGFCTAVGAVAAEKVGRSAVGMVPAGDPSVTIPSGLIVIGAMIPSGGSNLVRCLADGAILNGMVHLGSRFVPGYVDADFTSY